MARGFDAAMVAEPWRTALELAWEAHSSGNIGVGAVLTDRAGEIVATGRNRVFDADAPPGRLRSTYLAHAEMMRSLNCRTATTRTTRSGPHWNPA